MRQLTITIDADRVNEFASALMHGRTAISDQLRQHDEAVRRGEDVEKDDWRAEKRAQKDRLEELEGLLMQTPGYEDYFTQFAK
jgi:hypothetical protein